MKRCTDVLLSRANPVAGWFERSAIEQLGRRLIQRVVDRNPRRAAPTRA